MGGKASLEDLGFEVEWSSEMKEGEREAEVRPPYKPLEQMAVSCIKLHDSEGANPPCRTSTADHPSTWREKARRGGWQLAQRGKRARCSPCRAIGGL